MPSVVTENLQHAYVSLLLTMKEFPDLLRIYRSANSANYHYLHKAHDKHKKYHGEGTSLLNLKESDGLRLKIVADKLQSQCGPLLVKMRRMRNVPKPWLLIVTECIYGLEIKLRRKAEGLDEDGKGGKYVYTLVIIIQMMANSESSANYERPFKHSNSGTVHTVGSLRTKEKRVPRRRVLRQVLKRVGGVRVRMRSAVIRRKSNPRSMAIWHCVGQLKAITWGIVVHGFIDGHSCKVHYHVCFFEYIHAHFFMGCCVEGIDFEYGRDRIRCFSRCY